MNSSENSKIVFRGAIFEMLQEKVQVGSKLKTFEYARRGPGTRVIIVSDDHKMILTREFRNELNNYDFRIPGGKVFDSLVEFEEARLSQIPLLSYATEAAKRELVEETGYKALSLETLGISKCGATVLWDLYYFLCQEWEAPTKSFQPQAGEDISLEWYTFPEVKKFCLDGTISEERTAITILKYFSKLGI